MVIYQLSQSQALNLVIHEIPIYYAIDGLTVLLLASLFWRDIKAKRTGTSVSSNNLKKAVSLFVYIAIIIAIVEMTWLGVVAHTEDYINLKHQHFLTYTGKLSQIDRYYGRANSIGLNKTVRVNDGMYSIKIPDIRLKLQTDDYIPFRSNVQYEITYLPFSGRVIKVVQLDSN